MPEGGAGHKAGVGWWREEQDQDQDYEQEGPTGPLLPLVILILILLFVPHAGFASNVVPPSAAGVSLKRPKCRNFP